MENIIQRINNLLTYAEHYLYMSPEGRAVAYNNLLEFFQVDPSYEEEIVDENIEDILDDLTAYAVENGIIDEDAQDKFPDKLMSMVMPSQDDIIRTYSRIHFDHGRDDAEAYFLNVVKYSRYALDAPAGVAWKVKGINGDFTVLIPPYDEEKPTEGFYPKCPVCLANSGFS